MNALDLVVAAAAVVAFVGGYRIGFLARVGSWVGLAAGFYLASRVAPAVIDLVNPGTSSGRLLVLLVVLVVGSFALQAVGLVIGHSLRTVLPIGGARTADRVAGGIAGGLFVLVVVWLALPALASVRGSISTLARGSAVAQFVNDVAPRPPDTFSAFRRLVAAGFPEVFSDLRPSLDTGAPPPTPGLQAGVQDRVLESVVKIEGEACRRIQEGTGFVIGDGVVVTNAHVVAGEKGVRVVRPDGKQDSARVVVFDANRDLAVLAVPNLGLPALAIGQGAVGEQGAVFGHPGGQDQVRIAPAAIREQVKARGRDLYNTHPTERDVYVLASFLAPGDSGAPLVSPQGAVIGVAFAIAPDRSGTAYALVRTELDAALVTYNRNPRASADTGACI